MHTPLKRNRRLQDGLTLVELLVAMIIMTVISTMLVGGWISLQRSYAFTQTTNTARAAARDALDRIASELRAAQPPTSEVATPFYFALAAPYACGPNSCVFYSAYNNFAAADGAGLAETGSTPRPGSSMRLTAIWLDASGTSPQKTLYWQRDTNNNGTLDAGDRKAVLARNVVNGVYTGVAISKPIFTYYFRNPTSGAYSDSYDSTPTVTPFTSATVADLRSVQVEIVIDANLSHTPTFVDLITTVRPRNATGTD
jgi:prepilin-type N-terminal cleavage/methylation domain-containing protein